MATGIPKRDASASHGEVHLAYEGKKPVNEIINGDPVQFNSIYSQSGVSSKRLYFGDNLDVLRLLVSDPAICGKINLIYIDPPFATQSQFVSRKQSKAYEDTLSGAAFVEFLRRRLILLHKLLSNNGSIYLHLDEKMIFEMKMIMDEIFGVSNYRNMIVRKKCNPKNYTRKTYGNIADFILFYTKSEKYIWNKQTAPLSENGKKEYYYTEEQTGRKFMKVPLHAPGSRNGETGKPWRGKMPPPGKHWQYTPKILDEMDARGEIFWSKNGNPRRKVYLDEHPGVTVQDIWLDFRDAHNQNIKITGYPTEKNPNLIRRIVAASSNPGGLVLDCFAGSGTTLAVADDMQRSWIGIDNSIEALKTILHRFENGLQPMGDFIDKQTHPKRHDYDQQTLFDSLRSNTALSQSPSTSIHRSTSDFTLFVPSDSPIDVYEVVNEWKKRINDSSVLPSSFGVAEAVNYADITNYLGKKDKRLAKIINETGACRLAGGHADFEFLVNAIISQQLSKAVADTIMARFRGAFPKGKITPGKVLEKPGRELRETGISARKCNYIYDLCRRIEDRTLRLAALQSEDDDAIRRELKQVKGIGDWTADMYLLFGLARLDVFPINDLALRKAIAKVYKVQQDDMETILKVSERWRPYRSIGSWYLYRHGN